VSAADDKSKERRLEIRTSEHCRVDMPPEVIHSGHWPGPRGRQALGHADSDQQAAGQARTAGDRDEVEVVTSDTGTCKAEIKQVRQAFEVVSGRQLWHHAAELGVKVDLGVDDVGEDATPIRHHRDRSFVAAGLDT
jgi:hypothetical protein